MPNESPYYWKIDKLSLKVDRFKLEKVKNALFKDAIYLTQKRVLYIKDYIIGQANRHLNEKRKYEYGVFTTKRPDEWALPPIEESWRYRIERKSNKIISLKIFNEATHAIFVEYGGSSIITPTRANILKLWVKDRDTHQWRFIYRPRAMRYAGYHFLTDAIKDVKELIASTWFSQQI